VNENPNPVEEQNPLTLQDLLERDKDKIAEQLRHRDSQKTGPEWLMLAEFGKYFGYEGVKDVRENRISFAEMHELVKAARIVNAIDRFNNTTDIYAAIIAPHDKAKLLKKTLEGLREQWQQTQ